MLHPQFHMDKPRDSKLRSLLKTVIYRAFSAADTVFFAWLFLGPLAYLFGGHLAATAAFGLVDMLWNTVFYYIYERVWSHIDLKKQQKENGNGKAKDPLYEPEYQI